MSSIVGAIPDLGEGSPNQLSAEESRGSGSYFKTHFKLRTVDRVRTVELRSITRHEAENS